MDKFRVNILFILLLVIFNQSSTNNIYKLPFGLFNLYEKETEEDLINNIFHNYLYVNLSIGTPPQIIPFHLDVNSQSFYASKKYFNRTASSTYEQISKTETTYSNENVISGFNSKDILIINGKAKKINFIFETKHNKDNDIGCIGLVIPTKIHPEIYSFSASLITAGFINSFIWTLKFDNTLSPLDMILGDESKILGELIIGDDPHNYEEDKNLYNDKNILKLTALWTKDDLYWDVIFDSVFLTFKGKMIEKDKEVTKIDLIGDNVAELNPDIGFIVGPDKFYHYVNKHFFRKYSSICHQYRVDRTLFRVLECKNTESFDVSSFPDISFQVEDITFTLTYKDLFILDTKLNKYIFLIMQEGYTFDWVLGRLFLNKFQLIFNERTKTVGYYKSMDYYSSTDYIIDKIFDYAFSFMKIIFITLPSLYIVYIFVTKCKSNKRKKRKNELENEKLDDDYLLKDKKDVNKDNENNLELE